MGARWKVLVVVAAIACAVALAGCASQGGSSSASSAASTASSAASSSASSSSAAEPAASSPSSSASSSASAPASGSTAEIGLEYSAGTGYEWTYAADPEGIVELADQKTESRTPDANVTGGPQMDFFTFRAVQPGEVVLTFDLVRSWETGQEPAETQIYAFTVTDDLQMVLNPYKSDFEYEPEIG